MPAAPAKQTIGFQTTGQQPAQPAADARLSFLALCFVGKNVQLTVRPPVTFLHLCFVPPQHDTVLDTAQEEDL